MSGDYSFGDRTSEVSSTSWSTTATRLTQRFTQQQRLPVDYHFSVQVQQKHREASSRVFHLFRARILAFRFTRPRSAVQDTIQQLHAQYLRARLPRELLLSETRKLEYRFHVCKTSAPLPFAFGAFGSFSLRHLMQLLNALPSFFLLNRDSPPTFFTDAMARPFRRRMPRRHENLFLNGDFPTFGLHDFQPG